MLNIVIFIETEHEKNLIQVRTVPNIYSNSNKHPMDHNRYTWLVKSPRVDSITIFVHCRSQMSS